MCSLSAEGPFSWFSDLEFVRTSASVLTRRTPGLHEPVDPMIPNVRIAYFSCPVLEEHLSRILACDEHPKAWLSVREGRTHTLLCAAHAGRHNKGSYAALMW